MIEMVKIAGVREENPTVKTFTLDKQIDARPGQFCMLWIPGLDEKPFGFAKLNGNIEIMVRSVGSYTREMMSLDEGDLIGFRGPYGDGQFKLKGKHICVVSGGVGIAPLLPLVDEALADGRGVSVIHGAKTKQELIPLEKRLGDDVSLTLTTDDGSCGMEGTACDALRELLDGGVDQICACGPEPMMKSVLDVALDAKIYCQLTLERYLKCGIGVCGHCSIDESALMVCRDGPVFEAKQLVKSEFGRYKRDKSGAIIDL
ncbi:MAG: dihydroorotate dehydrogenase electron transfer subunit [Candidatus Altiarchaeales archaeon ex4484_96]|nr:MAG: dihydroorotate dehydrogenase electron transfer subunit [Candidatus Altiarchaeales archaeon ex4484_96]